MPPLIGPTRRFAVYVFDSENPCGGYDDLRDRYAYLTTAVEKATEDLLPDTYDRSQVVDAESGEIVCRFERRDGAWCLAATNDLWHREIRGHELRQVRDALAIPRSITNG